MRAFAAVITKRLTPNQIIGKFIIYEIMKRSIVAGAEDDGSGSGGGGVVTRRIGHRGCLIKDEQHAIRCHRT